MEHFIDLQFLLIVLAITGFCRVEAGSSSSFMCAQVGSISSNYDWTDAGGMVSIGADNFQIQYAGAFDSATTFADVYNTGYSQESLTRDECPYSFNIIDGNSPTTDVEACPGEDLVQIRIYTVQQKHRTLKGWLHVEIELTDNKNDEIEAIYVQMRDEYHNAVGEFMPEGSESCPRTRFPQPTRFQILPCTAIGKREAKPCSALFMVKKSQLNSTSKAFQDSAKYLGNQDPGRGISFTWRFSEYWCNRHLRIRADAMILTKNNIDLHNKINAGKPSPNATHGEHKLLRKAANFWIKSDWFGSYDIRLPKDGPFKCDELVIDGPITQDEMTPTSKSAKTWLTKLIKSKFSQDYFHPDELYRPEPGKRYYSGKSCQVNPRAKPPGPKFGGRCAHLWHKLPPPSGKQLQDCNLDPKAPEFEGLDVNFDNYSAYRSALFVARINMCAPKRCYLPETPDEIKIILNLPKSNFTTTLIHSTMLENLKRPNTSIVRFYLGRKYHGMMTILAAMFFTPLSIFTARYMKESFMRCKCGAGNWWYWVHIGCSLGSMCAYFTSLTALTSNIESWGRSLDKVGVLHDNIGWLSMGVFGILLVSGALRCGRESNQKFLRTISISLHSVAGFIHYFINLVLIIISTKIPGSPSLGGCVKGGNNDGMPSDDFPGILGLVIGWLLIDVVLHVTLTVFQLLQDRKLGIRRGWYCPILPVLPGAAENDMRGSGPLKLLFILYIVLCCGFSFGSIGMLAFKDLPEHCKNGLMSCDSNLYPLGCTEIAKAYTKRLADLSG